MELVCGSEIRSYHTLIMSHEEEPTTLWLSGSGPMGGPIFVSIAAIYKRLPVFILVFIVVVCLK